jgi:hypothetical protein
LIDERETIRLRTSFAASALVVSKILLVLGILIAVGSAFKNDGNGVLGAISIAITRMFLCVVADSHNSTLPTEEP